MIFQFYFASVRIECINICPVHFYLSSRSDDVNLPLFLSFSLTIDVVQAQLCSYLPNEQPFL